MVATTIEMAGFVVLLSATWGIATAREQTYLRRLTGFLIRLLF